MLVSSNVFDDFELDGPTFRSSPVALSDKERASNNPGEGISTLLVNQESLRIHNTASFAFVIDTQDLASKLELSSGRGHRKWLEKFYRSLPINHSSRIKFRDTGDWRGAGSRVEVDNLLVFKFESYEGF
jgi:hypothetical protein